jgi:hypothetical protein
MNLDPNQTTLLGFGILTFVVAGIAQGKNRSGFNWWLASILVTPPIALLILLFSKPLPSKYEYAVVKYIQMKEAEAESTHR